ncbi:MAG: MGMT family protein [Thermodesulfobacteriota bacterium]
MMRGVRTGTGRQSTDRTLYRLWVETAWGRCCLTYAGEPFLLFGITLPGSINKAGPDSKLETGAVHPSAILVGQALADYFDGCGPAVIPGKWLALEQLTANERLVLKAVRQIPYGATRTYAEVAGMAGFPRGARFAGNTLHKNPFPVIIPCHRVVRSDGSIGGFASGCEMKEKMIALERQKGSRGQGFKGSRG